MVAERVRSALPALPAQQGDVPWPVDTWPRAALDPRVDTDRVESLVARAFGDPGPLGETRALLCVHRGAIVLEQSAEGLDDTTTHISWSMAKSILHAVFGTLVRDGLVRVDAPAGCPEWSSAGDPRSEITIDQLLKMRSGLRFVEVYEEGHESDVIEMLFKSGKADVAAFAAGFELEHPPGSAYSYSSGTSNILSAVSARLLGRRGQDYLDYLEAELFGPLGMRSAESRMDEAGHFIASSFVFATAQDFARFGLLYLRDGVWEGRRLLPEGWVDHARTPISQASDEPHAYGSHFWVPPGDLGVFQCQGYQGQRIAMVPALDLVVVRLGDTPAEDAPHLNRFMQDLIDCFACAASR